MTLPPRFPSEFSYICSAPARRRGADPPCPSAQLWFRRRQACQEGGASPAFASTSPLLQESLAGCNLQDSLASSEQPTPDRVDGRESREARRRRALCSCWLVRLIQELRVEAGVLWLRPLRKRFSEAPRPSRGFEVPGLIGVRCRLPVPIRRVGAATRPPGLSRISSCSRL